MAGGGRGSLNSAYIDTHVAVWLHDGLVEKISSAAREAIEAHDLLLSPMVYLEFEYLHKRNRIRLSAPELFAAISATFGVTLCPFPFPAIAEMATHIDWTNDPFDRLITAQAQANQNAPLITNDAVIRRYYAQAIW